MKAGVFLAAGLCFMIAFYAAIANWVGYAEFEEILTRVSCLFGVAVLPLMLVDRYWLRFYNSLGLRKTPETPLVGKIRDGKIVAAYGECEICKLPIGGVFVGTGSGKAHQYCYHKNDMPENHLVFERVLYCRDQHLLRQVLDEQLSDGMKDDILRLYNASAKELWERRQKNYRGEYEKLVLELTKKEVEDAKIST